MYSSFTVKLIEEVQKREILYNAGYVKRPRSEKEACWNEIAEILICKENNFKLTQIKCFN
mgnify:CR=1 FL=1